jgi:MarR family transcriptional regulator, organic hydroperoxide resistance regulator
VSNRTRSLAKFSGQVKEDAVASAVTSIRRLVRVLRLNAQRTQAVAGISAAQLFVLQQLRADENLSLNALAERTLTDRSSVAGVVDRLQSQHLVERTVDPTDRRRASVRITAAGRRMVVRAPKAPTTALIAALRALPMTERTALARSLARLNEALGVGNAPATMLFADVDQVAMPGRKTRRRK